MSKKEVNMSFYAGHLSRLVTEEMVIRRFSKYGKVLSVKFDNRPNTRNKDDTIRYATIDMFITREKAVKCSHKLSNKKWFKQDVDVQKVNDRFFNQLENKRIVVENFDEIEREIEEYESRKNAVLENAVKNVFDMLDEAAKIQETNDDGVGEKNETDYIPTVSAHKWFNPMMENNEDTENDVCDDFKDEKEETEYIPTVSASKWFNQKDTKNDDNVDKRIDTKYPPIVSAPKRFIERDADDESNDLKHTDNDKLNDFSELTSTVVDKKSSKSAKETANKLTIQDSVLEKSSYGWKNYNDEFHKTNITHDQNTMSLKVSNVADEKRLKSLEEKKNAMIERKRTIKRALSSIDSRPNKKIIFQDSENGFKAADNSYEKNYKNSYRYDEKSKYDGSKQKKDAEPNIKVVFEDSENDFLDIDYSNKKSSENLSTKKNIQLFDDSDDDDDNHEDVNSYSFDVKAKYSGSKGEKLFELQSRFGDDERFRMDERFYESDEEETDVKETSGVNDATDNEVQEQLKVLQSLIGDDHLTNEYDKQDKPRVRFNPLIREHEKFVLKQQTGRDKKKKKEEEEVDDKPTVSKERFYEVKADELKESLNSTGTFKFDFSQLNVESEEESETDPIEATDVHSELHKSLTNFDDDRFGGDFYYYEDENENTEKSERNVVRGRKLWGQNFFFSSDDPRFQEGTDFIQTKLEQAEEQQLREKVYIIYKKYVKIKRNLKNFYRESKSFPENRKIYRAKRKSFVE